MRAVGAPSLHSPLVAIGGVGGSGTRVVADIAQCLGIAIGDDLNGALDNLAFTLLFKEAGATSCGPEPFRHRAGIFAAAMHGGMPLSDAQSACVQALVEAGARPVNAAVQHDVAWLRERASALHRSAARTATLDGPWGWKEPNTHVVLPQLVACFPTLRYVHVVRNGLDMAFSENLNQLDFWGSWWLGRRVERTPRDALAYWCAVHRRAESMAVAMGERFFWLDYDGLCAEPLPWLRRLMAFLGYSDEQANALLSRVSVQPSSGRRRHADLGQFAAPDLDYLRQLGHLE